ncbi:hypothetical protein HA520_14340 [Azotobacter chroococcum]|uniref:Uncharacterized protein n=1 Tax=Azotobacter chroococcum TaxID=353 RepID=A0AA44C8W9_9GAMM|nr:hypothetical protein [Azotobacter chroococcum]NHN78442.1 hypothetical protein [Azotobacter chroococcum]
MPVRYYSSLDTGAPAQQGSRLIDYVKAILKACLVDGYGSKPAAGWSMGHEHADGFSLFNGTGYINFVANGSQCYTAYIMESITDGSTALAGGVNRRSGSWYDGSASAARQQFYTSGFYNLANPHWFVVADEKTCTFMWGVFTSGLDAGGSYAGAHHFGNYITDLGQEDFCSMGGVNTSSTSSQTRMYGYSGMVLRNPFTGLVDQGTDAIYASLGASFISGQVYSLAQYQVNELTLVRSRVHGYGTTLVGSTSVTYACACGRLRGLMTDPVLTHVYASKALSLFGVADTWQGRVQPITLAGGKQLVPCWPNTGDMGYFVSLDSADWG